MFCDAEIHNYRYFSHFHYHVWTLADILLSRVMYLNKLFESLSPYQSTQMVCNGHYIQGVFFFTVLTSNMTLCKWTQSKVYFTFIYWFVLLLCEIKTSLVWILVITMLSAWSTHVSKYHPNHVSCQTVIIFYDKCNRISVIIVVFWISIFSFCENCDFKYIKNQNYNCLSFI